MEREKEMFLERQYTNLDDYLVMGNDVFINSFPTMQRKEKLYIGRDFVELHRLYLEDVYLEMLIQIENNNKDKFLKLKSN